MKERVNTMDKQDKVWQLSKELASLIIIDEAHTLTGEERNTYNVMVAQDFYNLFNAYNLRYKDKAKSERLTAILQELEDLLVH